MDFCVYFQDHSLMEWSYKKAITIQVYSAYDPIPVPLNLISNCITLLWSLRNCTLSTRSNIPTNKQRVSGDIYSITTAACFGRSRLSVMKNQYQTEDRIHSRCNFKTPRFFPIILSWVTNLNVYEITVLLKPSVMPPKERHRSPSLLQRSQHVRILRTRTWTKWHCAAMD